ncbi:MAG: putative Ig domain-containing protein, partial [Verrucomicrobiota bacterium]
MALGAVVTTTAGEVVVGYQWLMSTNNQSPFIGVGNSSTLSMDNIQTTNTGYYYVNVFYQSGGGVQTALSSTINLIVVRQPGIVTQPVSVSSPVASNVVFSVTVGGVSPLHFQWRQNGTNLVDNGRITGSAGTNLAIGNLMLADSGNYDMVATNLYGSATSQVATLQVFLAQPIITSPTNELGKQGCPFNYPITATGTAPITFGATGLPDGLTLDPTNGLISGVPTVAGVFDIALFATNAVQVTDTNLVLTLADDIPVITSATNAVGQQAVAFSYTITATNNPVSFSASPLPAGLSVDPVGGVISGVPLVSGSFDITILVTNAYGSDSETLTLDLATSAPILTSPLVENGLQGQPLSYSIMATNSAVSFSASPLPTGLSLNAASGVISGVPLVNGTYAVTIGAVNEYGADSQTLTLNLATGLPVITSSLNATGG